MPNDQEMRLKSERHYNESIDKSLRKEVIVYDKVEKTVGNQDWPHPLGSVLVRHRRQYPLPDP